LDLIANGFKASRLESRQFGASRLNSPDLANRDAGIPVIEVLEDQSFSTWMEWHYRWALTHCEMHKYEDFRDIVKLGTIIGAQFLLDE
jgi:hypothetical protein